jgi:hypothetical protein
MRRKFDRDRFWWLSMGLLGEVGTLVILLWLMGWGFGSLFVWGGEILLNFRFDPGVGSKISFWENVWCWESSIKDSYPGLFSIARLNEASIADYVERSNGVIQWNIVFTRLIHDWKVEVLASFYSRLYSFKLQGNLEDKLWWIPSSKGSFEVSMFYRVLSPHGSIPFPWKCIWRTKILPRVAFFA